MKQTRVTRVVMLSTALAIFLTGSLRGADPDFQDFFTAVCAGTGAPTGDLAARCAETGSGTGDGDLSGDSESSLNPSQTLSGHDGALADARSRSKEARKRGERLREGDDPIDLDDDGLSRTFGPWSLIVNTKGEGFDTERNPGGDPERGYDGDLFGAAVGIDYRRSEQSVVGAILAIEQQDSEFDEDLMEGAPFEPASSAGSMESDSVDLTLFASYAAKGNFFVDGSVGFRSADYTLRRSSVFQESGRSAQVEVLTQGSPGGTGWWASVDVGRDAHRGAWSLTPSAGIVVASSEIDRYIEVDLSGSGLNMQIGGTERESLLAHLGLAISYAASTRAGVLVPQVRLEWNHEFDNDPVDVLTAFALDTSNTQFGLQGEDPDEDYFDLAFSLTSVRARGWASFVDVAAVIGYEDFNRYRVTAGLRKEY